MKRDRYTGEYEKVRRQASLAQTEFFDPDEPAEESSAARIEAIRLDFHDRMREADEIRAAKEADKKIEHDDRMREFDRSVKLREYAALGLTPPEPLVSLALLQSIGWKVERFMIDGAERWELIRPAYLMKQESDVDQE